MRSAILPDPDDLDRSLDYLADRHGNLTISAPDARSTLTIVGADGARFHFTAQGRVIQQPRKTGR